jgi:hypothetical protein
MSSTRLSLALIVWSAFGSLAHACSTHGSNATIIGWLPTGSSGGVMEGLVTLESTLVAPTSTTTCTAGIGMGTTGSPLPAGVNVVGLEIVVVNTTDGSHTPFAAFSFVPNSVTTAALAAGAGSSGPPGTNPLFPGATWFGFSSVVNPFLLPSIGPDEFTAFDFTVEVAESLLPLVLDAQFAGGEGLSDGTPNFGGDHPAQYFTARDPSVVFVPEPSALLMMVLAACWLLAFRGQSHVR